MEHCYRDTYADDILQRIGKEFDDKKNIGDNNKKEFGEAKPKPLVCGQVDYNTGEIKPRSPTQGTIWENY